MSFKHEMSLKFLRVMVKWGTINQATYEKFAKEIVLKKYGLPDDKDVKMSVQK